MGLERRTGKILATINDNEKQEFSYIAKELQKLGYSFICTSGTAKYLKSIGIEAEEVKKISDGEPNILDIIKGLQVDLVVNTPTKGNNSHRDGFIIRRTAIEKNIEVITTMDTLRALVNTTKVYSSEEAKRSLEVYRM